VLSKLRECMALGRELTDLERLVGIDRDVTTVASYPLPAPRSSWEAPQQGQRLAEEERRRLGLGVGPAPNIAEILETQGVRTGLVDLPEDVSGLTLSDKNVGLFVVANKRHHVLRRRFSFTHEYCHIVADGDRFGLVSKTSERDSLLEVRANAFAANFLMPEEGVLQFVAGLGKGKPSRFYGEVFDGNSSLKVEGRSEPQSQNIQLYDVVQMAHHFEVSRSAAIYRLRRLRLITDSEREHLQALDDAGKGRHIAQFFGLSEPNHEEARNEFKHRFLGLALEAYRREEISMGKLKELSAMVELSSRDLERLMEETGLEA
jgi:Zn-dependent peptidase ImmA (M78 family)